jgi:cytoskeletal protein CcmA (bactofilin family)
MSEVRIKKAEEKDIDTILAEDIDFQGVLNFDNSLMIKGAFQGEINAKGNLFIGPNAHIEAKIKANLISIRGKVKGDITALSHVELFSTAKIEGDIFAPSVEMEKGCLFNGQCRMNGKMEETERVKDIAHASK